MCDCNLLDFYDWLRDDVDEMKYTIPDHQDLTCNQPEALSGRAIIELQRSELICQKSQWDKQSNNAPTIVLSKSQYCYSGSPCIIRCDWSRGFVRGVKGRWGFVKE